MSSWRVFAKVLGQALFVFSKFDEGIQIDQEGLYSVIPEEVGLKQASLIQGKTVLDGFTGVGGSAIAFARAGKLVTTIETNHDRVEMARNNAEVYGAGDKIKFIEGDFFESSANDQSRYSEP